jgi:3-isopropylmalate/(R)-2-methylmalate dehydratase large subunit
MSIEGGARFGYVNPDATTVDYLRGRPHVPSGAAFDRAAEWWKSVATEPGARFDDVARLDAAALQPVVTWGINPGMSVGVGERIPAPDAQPEDERSTFREALAHMGFEAGQPIKGAKIDVAFVGSCTNGRLSDLRIAAEVAKKGGGRGVRALIVPGSQQVAKAAEAEGLHPGSSGRRAFSGAGRLLHVPRHERRQAQGREMSASSSNHNFIGRRGARRAHPPHELGHGRGRRPHRRRDGCQEILR